MLRNPRLGAAIRRSLLTRRAGWGLAAALALLGALLGWHQLTRAAALAGQTVGETARLVLDAGWLLLLLAAVGLVLGLAFSGPRRAAFPAALIALAAALGLVGWQVQVSSTPTPPELENTGNIMVYTSDPKASVSLTIYPGSAGPRGETLSGFRGLTVSLFVKSAKGPVWWLVALGRDARFPPGEFPVSGTMPKDYSNDQPASFVNGVEWPIRADPDDEEGPGTVIFGEAPGGGTFHDMTVKVWRPLLKDVGEPVTLSTPLLGRPDPNPEPIGKGTMRQFYNRKADPQLLATLGNHRWYEPKQLEVALDAERSPNPELTGVRLEAGTAPVAPFRTQWQAKDRLKVDASFRRPGQAARNQRFIFLAGVLVSLAASFFVWALELLLGPGRDPVAARSGRPHRQD